ncbi:AT-rich interactive domain-containing protein 2 isoform X1 [Hyalella azteca]|uniref:AT-rich interactive domain-containing protein 2 isoform X1 n=1 Tax=Hyalella azteca TaxID=294128 RepID=A0A8B7P984_HYAAZ|nr:AT-rich interactive domain-containing protein 2 isoform X1 [Hyalella azteca]
MSKDNSSETEAYDKEYDAFLKKLNEFHQQRGTPFKRLPRINGKGVDLYLLYVVVTARGGWQKVNARNEWEEILEDFRLPPACVNSSVALKQIYMRYLDTYERVTFLGSDADDKNNDNDEDDASHPGARSRRSVRALNLVPLTYNNAIHNVAESMRASANMCTTLLKPSQYDRLFLSLCSPMPNEHDFSFNLCTLLSNEGRQVMRLAQCPRLLEIMLGHVGVFRDVSTRKYFVSNIVEQKNKNLVQFWLDSVEDCRVLELLLPPGSSYDEEDFYRSSSPQDRQSCPSNSGVGNRSELPALGPNNTNNSDSSRLQVDDSQKYGPVNNSSSILVTSAANDSARNVNSVSNSCRELVIANSSVKCYEDSSEASDVSKRSNEPLLEDICRKLRRELCMEGALRTPEDIDLFHCGRDSGLQDSEGTRIAQLIHILRNLSFEEDNVTTLAQSKTCLRFLVLCMCSRFGGLSIQALDTLGNIGSEVVLADPKTDSTTRLLLWHVCQGVFSEDRARVLRSLEVLNKLAVCDANEEVMGENIEQEVYEQICRYLTIHDIMLLIYTLESLYSLSSLGSASCNAIVRAQGSIHTLVALLTVEAQSYGPEACIGMKVVETVTGVVSDPDAPPAPAPPPPVAITSSSTPAPPPPAPSIAPPHPQPPLLSSVVSTPTLAAANAAALQNGGHGSGGANAINKTPAKNVLDMKKSVMSSAIPADVEEFVCDWIRRSYEAHPGTLLEQAVVFRHFSSAMHALGKKQGFNPVMLSSCFRKVYGFKVGPTRHNPKDASDKWYYHDLRRRDVPLPIRPADRLGKNKLFSSSAPLTNTPVLSRPDPPASVGSSILKAQLSAPLRPISPAPPRTVQPQQPALGASPSSSGSGAASPISSPPPPYSPSPRLSPRSTHSPSPYTHPSPCATPPPPPPPMPRQENSALIKSLLANKVTDPPVVGGLAGMLAAPLTTSSNPLPSYSSSLSPQSSFASHSPSFSPHQHSSDLPSTSCYQAPHTSYTPTDQSTSYTTSMTSFDSSQGSNDLLPPPPPYPHYKQNQRLPLPSMQMPSILKTCPAPIPPSLVASSSASAALTPNLGQTAVAEVSRNMQKQQQQQQQLVCVEGDTNGTLCNDSSSVDTSINGVTINGEPAKMEEELVGAGREEHEVTSFEGILQNGLRDTGMSGSTNNTTVISVATDTEALLNNISVTNNNNSNDGIADGSGSVKKNVLADLLEKTVGGDILNGVVDKEIRLCNGPLSAGVNNVNNSGGLKRPGADDFDDCGGGTKRLAIDRGDGKITLYVSQNGDGSCDAIGGVDGSGAAPQQVVFSGQSVANIIAVSTPIATQRQMNSTQGQLVSSQGQLLSSQGQLVTSQGQLVSSQGQLVTTQGQLITSQGQMIASGPQLITSTGQLISSTGQLITSGAQLVTSTGQLIPAAGQLMTTQNGQKVVVQGGFPQVIGGQVVLSQGGHLVVGGNTSGGGGETVLLGGQVLQQNASGSGTQVIGNTGQMLAQGPQQVLTSNTGHIIAQGQGALLAPAAGTGHVITQGQIIAQPQILQSQGQIISQGSNQILGASAGQIITTPSGQIVGQVTQAGQILGQINQAGQIVGQVNQAGQIVGQVNQAGQIVGQVNQAGQIVGQVNQAGQIVGQVNQAGQIVGQVNSAGQIVTQGSAVVSQGGTLLVQQSGTSGKTLIILPPGQKVLQQPGQQQIVMQPQTVGGAPILQVQQTPVSGGQVLHQQQTVAGGQVLQVVTNSNAVSGGVVRTIAPSSVGVIPASNSSLLNSNGGNQGLPAPVATAQSSGIKHPVSTSGSMTFVSNRGPVNSSSNNASSSQPPGPMVPAPQILASGIVRRPVMLPAPSPGGVAANVPMGIHSNPPKPGGLQYLCEWRGCNSIFSTPQQVYHHVCKIHCPPHLVEIQCQWAGCEPMVRKRFSTMTHLHDRHCNEQLLNVLAVRRQQIATSGKTDLPIPHTPPPHPGYAPNAAFHAIKRHALEVISQRDAVEKEGPVTKSIRLTSALVLRNLVIYSNSGRKLLRGYESELSNVAISTQESSRTVAQILHDLHISDQ